jgi:glycosyltransferase involved in cell wall biosynthesis
MRIAIDGRFLALPPSGTGTYLRHLLEELPAVAPDDELVVLDSATEGRKSRSWRAIPTVLRRDPRFRRFVWESAGFKATAKMRSPDLLHIPSFAAPWYSSVPFVVTIHDAIPFVLPEYRASRVMRLHLALMKRTTRQAALVLTPSQAAADDLARVLSIDAKKIRVTPEAADPRCVPLEDRQLPEGLRVKFEIDGPYVFTTGGLDVRKRVDLLIEAFAAALPELPANARLVVGGKAHSDNPVVYPPLQPVIDRLGIGERVAMTGWLTDEEKIALYQSAAIYATPSIYEGFGLTPLEAMACGTPVLATRRTSLPEIIGDAGLLVEPSVRELRDGLVRLFNDEALRADLGARGLQRAAQFSWRRTAELTSAAYHEAYESSPRKRIRGIH